jgi:hypothetical protein
MTEHNERVRPCGDEGADDHRSWPSYGSTIGLSSKTPTWAEQQVSDASDAPPQEGRPTVWSAAASVVDWSGAGDQIPSEESPRPVPEIGPDHSPVMDTAVEAVVERLEAVESPTWAEQQVSDASDAPPQEGRPSVWSARVSVVDWNGPGDQIPSEESPRPVPEIGCDHSRVEGTIANVDSVSSRDHARLDTQHRGGRRSVDELRLAHRSRGRRLALCLVVVIGLVVLFTGRGIRRSV